MATARKTTRKAPTRKKSLLGKKVKFSRVQAIALIAIVAVVGIVAFALSHASASCSSGSPLLLSGSNDNGNTSGCVHQLQSALNESDNASLSVDGNFGPATKAEVINFQKFWSLNPDGKVGPDTGSAICYSIATQKKATPAFCQTLGGGTVTPPTPAVSQQPGTSGGTNPPTASQPTYKEVASQLTPTFGSSRSSDGSYILVKDNNKIQNSGAHLTNETTLRQMMYTNDGGQVQTCVSYRFPSGSGTLVVYAISGVTQPNDSSRSTYTSYCSPKVAVVFNNGYGIPEVRSFANDAYIQSISIVFTAPANPRAGTPPVTDPSTGGKGGCDSNCTTPPPSGNGCQPGCGAADPTPTPTPKPPTKITPTPTTTITTPNATAGPGQTVNTGGQIAVGTSSAITPAIVTSLPKSGSVICSGVCSTGNATAGSGTVVNTGTQINNTGGKTSIGNGSAPTPTIPQTVTTALTGPFNSVFSFFKGIFHF